MATNAVTTTTPVVLDHIKKLQDLADPNRSYNLVETMLMKSTLEEIDKIVKAFQDVRTAIAKNYGATIAEYQEAGITESDGVAIVLLKQGRRSLNEEVARKLFPKECNSAQVASTVFDMEKFKKEEPALWDKYTRIEHSLTLTALEKHLSDEEVLKVINRQPNTYGVELVK